MNYKTNYSMQLQQNHLNKSFKINGTNYRKISKSDKHILHFGNIKKIFGYR